MSTRVWSPSMQALLLLFGIAVAAYFAHAPWGSGADVGTATPGVAGQALSAAGAQVGQPAPDFVVTALSGGILALSDYRERPVVIHFFASWWGSSWVETHVIDDAGVKYQPRGLVVLGVAVRDSPGALDQMVKRLGLAFPIGLDPDSRIAVGQYRVPGIPATVFIDREGLVQEIWVGALDRASLDRLIAGIL